MHRKKHKATKNFSESQIHFTVRSFKPILGQVITFEFSTPINFTTLIIHFALFSHITNAISAISTMYSSHSKGKGKVFTNDDYPKKDFTYTLAIGQ